MIVLRVLDDIGGDLVLIAEQCLVVVVRGEITIDHFRMVTDADL